MVEPMPRIDQGTETRVSVLETQVDNIRNSVIKLEEKIDLNYATLHHRISDLRDDLRSDFDSKHEKLINKLEERSIASNEQHQKLYDKMTAIEKWKWMVVGGAIVVGYFLAHLKIERLF